MEERRGTRVVLRPVSAGDGPLLRRWLADRELKRFAGHPFLPRLGTSWTTTQDAQFVIHLQEGRRPIGLCGLYGISHQEGTAEVGILLGEKDTWGHGYGPEALRLLLDHAYRDLGLTQISLCVHATNARAIRAYEKVGFTVERRLTVGRWLFGRGVEILVMTAVAPAYLFTAETQSTQRKSVSELNPNLNSTTKDTKTRRSFGGRFHDLSASREPRTSGQVVSFVLFVFPSCPLW